MIPTRRRLPEERRSVTKEFSIPLDKDERVSFRFTVGLYSDGSPGEVFVNMDKMATTLSGLMDAAAINMSIGLQYGIPLEVFISKMRGTQFTPAGFTGDSQVNNCTSPLDLLARWLEVKFPPEDKMVVTSEEIKPIKKRSR